MDVETEAMETVREVNHDIKKCTIRTDRCSGSFDAITDLEFINSPDTIARPILSNIGHQIRVLTVPTVHTVLGIAFPNLHTLVVLNQPIDSSRGRIEARSIRKFGVDTAEPGSTPLHTIVDCGVVPGNEDVFQAAAKPRRRKRAVYSFDELNLNDADLREYYASKRMYGDLTKFAHSCSRTESATRLLATDMLKPAQYQVVETFIPPAAGTGGIRAPQLTNITIQYAEPEGPGHPYIDYPFKLPPGLPYHQVKDLTLVNAQLRCWADVFLLELPEATRLRLVNAQVLDTWRVADDRISTLVTELQKLSVINGPAAESLRPKEGTHGTIPIPFWCVMPKLKHLSVVQTYSGNKPFPLYGHMLYLLDDAFPVLEYLSLIVGMPDEQKINNGPLIAEYLAILDQMRCRPADDEDGIKIGAQYVRFYKDTRFVVPNTEHKATFQYATHSIAVSCKMMRPRESRRPRSYLNTPYMDYGIAQCTCALNPNPVAIDVPKIYKTHRQPNDARTDAEMQ